MFDGDGSISRSGTGYNISCSNINSDLITSLAGILDHFGIRFTTKSYENNSQPQYKTRYNIYVHKKGIPRFNKLIGFRSQRKIAKMEECLALRRNSIRA